MQVKKYLTAMSILVWTGCQSRSQTQPFLSAYNRDSIIQGAYMLTKDDTNGVQLIFEKADDPRISHKAKYYGQSVYQAKMNALERISDVAPPKKISSEPDIEIINFYKDWATKSGYFNN